MTDKKLDILSVDFDWIENSRQQEELLTFLIPLIYDHKDITMAYMHEKIFPLISHGYDEYNIINIDHHHEIGYFTLVMYLKIKLITRGFLIPPLSINTICNTKNLII